MWLAQSQRTLKVASSMSLPFCDIAETLKMLSVTYIQNLEPQVLPTTASAFTLT